MTNGPRTGDFLHREIVIVGSGFGGVMAAWPLVHAGHDVLLIERGPWIERGPQCWSPQGTLYRTPHHRLEDHHVARTDSGTKAVTACSGVGGASGFYGAVSLRFREADFLPDPEIDGDSGARWPTTYQDLRPFYQQAERLLSVAGQAGEDPTEPPREHGYPAPLDDLSPVSSVIADAARSRGLSPFRLPLAINYSNQDDGRQACVQCDTCDTFACAVEAKNDLATVVVPELQRRGLDLMPETVVQRLHADAGRVVGLDCANERTGERRTITAGTVILAAGALGSPQLVLGSDLGRFNPAGDKIGRYLTRHCSAIVFALHPWLLRHQGRFHKQIGINDYYVVEPNGNGPSGKVGHIQQTQTPSMGTVIGEVGRLRAFLLGPLVRRITGLLVIAEDRPRYDNRVYVDETDPDRYGIPRLRIEHRYDKRDLDARRYLTARAREIHKSAGALASYVHKIDTFSHALGTIRMGDDPELAPLDADGKFRGLENLYVADGSALPTAAAVNPSLTIAANALRIGHRLADGKGRPALPVVPTR